MKEQEDISVKVKKYYENMTEDTRNGWAATPYRKYIYFIYNFIVGIIDRV